MSKPNSAMGRSRDFGIPGAPGKGDKSRVTNQSAYAQNFDEIDWGRKRPADVYAETDGEWRSRTVPGTKEFKSAPFLDVVEGKWDLIPENDRLNRVINDTPITNDLDPE